MNYYLIRSKSDPKSVRVVQAKSRGAAKAHIYSDLWQEPTPAKVDDVAQAAANGVKPEMANGDARPKD
jgi:hypothetical protein